MSDSPQEVLRDRGDRCPGVVRLFPAADGLIGRVRAPGGYVSSDQWTALADISDHLGDGDIHLTSRGNIQIRGIEDSGEFSEAVTRHGFLPSAAHDRMRNYIASPLSGRVGHVGDIRSLVRSTDRLLLSEEKFASLPGRTLFAFDDGRGDVIAEQPDFGVIATSEDAFDLVVGGLVVANVARSRAPQALVDLVGRWLEIRGDSWRVTEKPGAAEELKQWARENLPSAKSPHFQELSPAVIAKNAGSEASEHLPIGWIEQDNSRVSLAFGLPFGRIDSSTARLIGAIEKPTTVTCWKVVVVHDLEPAQADHVVRFLAPRGMVFDKNSPWLSVTACTGLPGCSRSADDVREHAVRAINSGQLPEGKVHFVGCERRCGAPHGFHVEYLALGDGEYEVEEVVPEVSAGKRYITDGNEIYRRSFSIIRNESDLSAFSDQEQKVAVRMIHAAGDTGLASEIEFSPNAVEKGYVALKAGGTIFTDVTMVATGVTRRRLPADNKVECLLANPETAARAAEISNTRSAAALDLVSDQLGGSIVAIGNAPTALFHLLDLLEANPDIERPAVIVGIPVGFVGAAESKRELADRAESLGVEYITVHGRRGGSAITCAALNAVACPQEILE